MNQSKPQRKSSVLEKANMLQNMQLPSPHDVANKEQASNEHSQKKKRKRGGQRKSRVLFLIKIYLGSGGAAPRKFLIFLVDF